MSNDAVTNEVAPDHAATVSVPDGEDTGAKGAGDYGKDVALSGLVTMLMWDIGLPVIGYYVARAAGMSTFNALLVATVVAALRLLWVVWRTKEIDAFAGFMLFIFAAGTAASFATGDPRFMLLKNALLTLVAGVVFLGSCVWGKPLSYAVARRLAKGEEGKAELTQGWAESADFRRSFKIMSLVWGVGLIVEALVRVGMIYTMDIDLVVAASLVVQVVTFAGLTTWNIRYIKSARAEAATA